MKRKYEHFSADDIRRIADSRGRVARIRALHYHPEDRPRFRRYVAHEARALYFAADCVEVLTDGTTEGVDQFRKIRLKTGLPWR